MRSRDPLTHLPSHTVNNQSGPRPAGNAYTEDRPLRELVQASAPAWVDAYLDKLGRQTGSDECLEWGFQANRNPPELKTFDRFGRRIDELAYHPAYHRLMSLAAEHGLHHIAWTRQNDGGHVAHIAGLYLLTQPEQGVCCPITMTHAVVPALRQHPDEAAFWEPLLQRSAYDPRCIPPTEKAGVTFGMAMTEKQGGSDVRANTTRAEPRADGDFELTGHKWFCSAPMSDAFLTLAQTEQGLSCFLVPRWRPDGQRNPFFIQRLKDKCGNRSNASAEIEYQRTWARAIGEPGHGVRTIIAMVQQTRLDAATAPVGMLRMALAQALHHANHRKAFGQRLIDQPLMRNVLADLALEVEAGLQLVIRLARAFDAGEQDRQATLFARIATPITKYWTNKRAPQAIYEAMECLGGNGYVEESILPRLYREAPVNSIWEGSGNVICLDVLRAMSREPETVDAYFRVLAETAGRKDRLDATADAIQAMLKDETNAALQARKIVETMAKCLQASLLLRHAPEPVAAAYCETRLSAWHCYGTLGPEADLDAILDRASPA